MFLSYDDWKCTDPADFEYRAEEECQGCPFDHCADCNYEEHERAEEIRHQERIWALQSLRYCPTRPPFNDDELPF